MILDRMFVVVQILHQEMNHQVENIKKNLNQKLVEVMNQKIVIQLHHHQNHVVIMIDEIQQDLHLIKSKDLFLFIFSNKFLFI
jgi:hypothetical protein